MLESLTRSVYVVALCVLLVLAACTAPETNPEPSPPPSTPTAASTATPLPTVVGTAIPGPGMAVGGEIGHGVTANGISIVVDDVLAYDPDLLEEPWYVQEGYALVVVRMWVGNKSTFPVRAGHFVLVDDLSNQYAQWGAYNDLPSIETVEPGQSVSGALTFKVPEPALDNALRLRCEPPGEDTRIEIYFGTDGLEYRIPTPSPMPDLQG